MVISTGLFMGFPCALVCDAQCRKAWGRNARPEVHLDPEDEDDFAYLADGELGEAPADPGTEEGDHAKPRQPIHNKWCWRECERAKLFPPAPGQGTVELKLLDFSRRVYNNPSKHPEAL